jgi:hypothetical protein
MKLNFDDDAFMFTLKPESFITGMIFMGHSRDNKNEKLLELNYFLAGNFGKLLVKKEGMGRREMCDF